MNRSKPLHFSEFEKKTGKKLSECSILCRIKQVFMNVSISKWQNNVQKIKMEC